MFWNVLVGFLFLVVFCTSLIIVYWWIDRLIDRFMFIIIFALLLQHRLQRQSIIYPWSVIDIDYSTITYCIFRSYLVLLDCTNHIYFWILLCCLDKCSKKYIPGTNIGSTIIVFMCDMEQQIFFFFIFLCNLEDTLGDAPANPHSRCRKEANDPLSMRMPWEEGFRNGNLCSSFLPTFHRLHGLNAMRATARLQIHSAFLWPAASSSRDDLCTLELDTKKFNHIEKTQHKMFVTGPEVHFVILYHFTKCVNSS